MTATLVKVTHDDLLRRRGALLAMFPVSADELARRVDEDTASAEEREAHSELEEIEFLLGNRA